MFFIGFMSLNVEVAKILYQIAELYSVKGEYFRSRAYLVAGQQVESLTDDIKERYETGSLEDIQGVGKGVAWVIREYIETGNCGLLEELRETLPAGAGELMALEGIGPKTIMKLFQELKVASIEELEKAAQSGRIRGLQGFGPKTEKNILQAIKAYKNIPDRFLLGEILPVMREIEDYMRTSNFVSKMDFAGSTRRMKESVGDLDILVASDKGVEVVEKFVSIPKLNRVLSKGTTRSTIIFRSNFQVDLRVVNPLSYGSALQYFTGSKAHNIKLRTIAMKLGYKLNEYGLFERKTEEKVAGESEESIYKALGLEFIEPELREDRGEIEIAKAGKLPKIIEYSEIKGDLHVHSDWSDGTATIQEIADRMKNLGLEYVAICDHSKSLAIARGLTEERLKEQMKAIDNFNGEIEGFTILKGVEVDIKKDGSLDFDNNILKDLDFVVASIHSGFKGTEETLTNRLITAIHNEYVSTIGHPTGRLILKRQPCQLNIEKILQVAAEQRVMMEINAFPNRLDLNDVNSKAAMEIGVVTSIGTDAHTLDQLRYLMLGVSVARRGWLKPKDVANSLGTKSLLKKLRR